MCLVDRSCELPSSVICAVDVYVGVLGGSGPPLTAIDPEATAKFSMLSIWISEHDSLVVLLLEICFLEDTSDLSLDRILLL